MDYKKISLNKRIAGVSYCFLLGVMYMLMTSCNRSNKGVSFYYWRTTFKLSGEEQKVLSSNKSDTLFVRYFEIAFNANDTAPHPVATIQFTDSIRQAVAPVVFIWNSVFEKLDAEKIPALADSVHKLVSAIDMRNGIHINQIQFDCDWTEKTKEKYFSFLRLYKQSDTMRVSATIRLHQVKFKSITGVPPVDYGVLMYYNMGNINAGTLNSVYDKHVADKYNAYVKLYPLPMDVALPIFAWGQQVRNNKVIALLNKMNNSHFENDVNFKRIQTDRYAVVNACFKGGYYFQKGDVVKIERISEKELKQMAGDIEVNPLYTVHRVIFYDLDENNTKQYDQKVFKAIADHIR